MLAALVPERIGFAAEVISDILWSTTGSPSPSAPGSDTCPGAETTPGTRHVSQMGVTCELDGR